MFGELKAASDRFAAAKCGIDGTEEGWQELEDAQKGLNDKLAEVRSLQVKMMQNNNHL